MRAAGTITSLLVLFAACKSEQPIAFAEASAGGPGGGGGRGWSPSRVAELYFSTGVLGYVEPCGCTSKPLGGIQRLSSVIKSGHANRALIDAGDLLFPSEGYSAMTADQHRLKAHILARVYRQLGAVAINVGPTDLTGGAELLKQLQREGAVPLVSANIRPVGDTGPAIAQSFVREIGGIRVGLTGVAAPERFSGIKGVAAIEYAPALRAEVKMLRQRGAELVIVLAHVGDAGARDLAQAVPEIDVIVRAPGAPIGEKPLPPKQVGDVLIVEAGSQGQHIGKMTLRFDDAPPPRPIAIDDGGERARRARELIERKIRAYRGEIESWRADPSKAAAIRAKEEQIAKLEASLNAPVEQTRAPDRPHIAVDLIALTEEVPADSPATDLLAAYYAQLKDMNASKGDVTRCAQPDKQKPTYVGTARCVSCHEAAYNFWKQTKHGAAWATLERQNKHFDLTCVGCHTVGFQAPGGFCRLQDVGELKDVGCENCHGPGSQHAITGDKKTIKLTVTEATCAATCHVPDHSDTFHYETYLLRITGEGHRLRSLRP